MSNLEQQLSALRREFEIYKTSNSDSIASITARLHSVELLLSLSSPTLFTIVANVLTKVAVAHLFWIHREQRWLSFAEVKLREEELTWMQTESTERLEDLAPRVMAKCKEREENESAGFTTKLPKECVRWEQERRRAKIAHSLSPTVSALPSAGYPEGCPVEDAVATIKTTYVATVNDPNKAHRYTAGTIADALKYFGADHNLTVKMRIAAVCLISARCFASYSGAYLRICPWIHEILKSKMTDQN
ncbi:hypothetical protein B0H13DRAFT_2675624 [Mycena leptocephala]|nr:hypothetical protein B0H13DRAFT_2675624 [Mycena leptocephala]